jgi:hypothetical protein
MSPYNNVNRDYLEWSNAANSSEGQGSWFYREVIKYLQGYVTSYQNTRTLMFHFYSQ